MTIIFRVDASLQIGSGHVMRCLSLADELHLRGAAVRFVCREHPGNLNDLIEAKGYPVTRLPQVDFKFIESPEDLAHMRWLGVAWEQDAADTIGTLGDTLPQWLIVDHYAIDRRWEQRLRPHVEKIMMIDDLADRPHECDLLLDQNLYQAMETRYDNLAPASCQKLLGPKYALLRSEFADARRKLRQRDGVVKRILVFFGGVDSTNETEKALQALTGISDRQFEVDVVVGGGNLHKVQISRFCEIHNGFHYHCQVDNIAELMAAADLSIGAGGTTTWERCAVGLPAIVMSVAENQVNIADSADKVGVLTYLGKSSEIYSTSLSQKIVSMLPSANFVSCMSEKALHLVVGNGVQLVADRMVQK